MQTTPTRWLAASLCALFAAACAQSNGDINRVQPNVVKKADLLDGEWFYRNTVTYTPFDTQFTYPGQTGSMEKLVFEIQEGNLVGYRSYPYTPGAELNVDPTSKVSGTTAKYCDAEGHCVGGKKYYGSPVVAFPIQSHFDIQRGYNPATGEVNNVISENSSDRPWNQREFMRVNWSANLLNRNSGMSWGTVQNPAGGSSSGSWIQANEPGSDPYDWPVFEYVEKNGKQVLNYFDVTGRYIANPDTIFIEGYGNVPMCYLSSYFQTSIDCSSSEIKMRISIAKVDTAWARDYEPLVYPNDLMSMFGFFRTERLNWDTKFGWDDSAVIRLAQRHRVWQEYYRKQNGEPDTGNPIPVADRAPKPVVYYFTPAAQMGGQARYDEFWTPGREIENDYDRAFRRAIAAAKGTTPDLVPQMFYLCNNPVKAGDPAGCLPPGKTAGFAPRVGDLRYSFVNTVAQPVANGLLGYGPSSADPETGQLISGMSNTYTWGVDIYGRSVLDHILLLEGELNVTDYVSGVTMKNFVNNNPAWNLAQIRQQNGALQSQLQGIPQTRDESKGAWQRPTRRLSTLVESLQQSGGLPKNTRDELRTAADLLAQNPEVEAAVLDNPDVQADLVNLLPSVVQSRAQTDQSYLRQVSRTLLTNIQAANAWRKLRLEWASNNSVTLADFYDQTMVGLAQAKMKRRLALIQDFNGAGDASCHDPKTCTIAESKTLADAAVAKEIRQEIWKATALHETGHTLNLRHNFQGSFDSINYPDQYWALRKESLTVAQNGVDTLPRTPADLKTALDGTQTQLDNGMHDYEYSSIMDYSGKIYGDWKGLGKYDEAAIIFAYSGTSEPGYVEVFNAARKDVRTFPGSDGKQLTVTGAALDLPLVNAQHLNPNVKNYTERFHYTMVPLHFGEGNDLGGIITDGINKLQNRSLKKWSEVKADEDRVRQMIAADPTILADPSRAASSLDGATMRVPYMFCSDESADGPVLSCNRFDRGPDYYEMVHSKVQDYWSYYFDSHFRRDKAWFSGNRAVSGTLNTFNFTHGVFKHWVYDFYKSADRGQEQATRAPLDVQMQDTWTMAVLDGVNQHLNVMSVPPAGHFMFRNLPTGPQWDVINEGDEFDQLNADGISAYESYYRRADTYNAKDFVTLYRGFGRKMYSRFDYRSGFNFFNRMSEAGHYNDQIGAMFAAVIPELEIQGVDITADSNRYNVPYYLVFREEFSRTFGALWANNETLVRPTVYKTIDPVSKDVTDTAAVQFPVHVKGQDLFQGFVYPAPELKTCTGGQTPPSCFTAEQNAAPAGIQNTWTSRIYGLYLGEALFKVNYDLDYAKTNQVMKVGGAEQVTAQAGWHTVEVNDFITGAKYVALERDGVQKDSTPAVRMINIANDYLSMMNDPKQCPLPLYLQQIGYSCMTEADANNPAQVDERRKYWRETFQDGTRDLDIMRGFYSVYGRAF